MPPKIGQTTVTASQSKLTDVSADLLALALFQDTKSLPQPFQTLDKATSGMISACLKLGDFRGKSNETSLIYVPDLKKCRRILLVGLGKKDDADLDNLRQAAGTVIRAANKIKAKNVAFALHQLLDDHDPEQLGQVLAEGAIVGRYEYRDHITPSDNTPLGPDRQKVSLIDARAATVRKLKAGARIGSAFALGQNITRRIANQPGNEINPPSLARIAQRFARTHGLNCRVLTDKQLQQKKMNAILAVGSGSAQKPRLIILEHNGRRSRGKTKPAPDVAVVGKAVTFDSGGLSLKPSNFMLNMKFDKCGGCSVIGILAAAAELKIPLNIVGLIPAVENMPSNTCYRPDDIIRTYSGKTVEIQNTDAEGRMILSDALTLAAEMKPKSIIDMATLTGAMGVALGEHYAGLFTNSDKLRDELLAASESSGDKVWPMPSNAPYLEQMRSKVADLRNVAGRRGASCTAAAFLGEFVHNIRWAHIDIAAVASTDAEKPFRAVGATGFGVRLVLEYLRRLK